MITVRSTINLAHQSVPNVIPAVQGDTGRSILFTLADFTIPAGATARYFITKPSGLAVYNDATIDGNTVLVDLTAQSLAEYGDCPGQVRIMLGQTVVTSFEFILHVEPFRGIDAVESTTETNIFDKAVEDAREAIAEAAEDAEEYISQAIDPTLTIPDKAADAKATGDAISDSADAVIAQMRAEIANVYPTETAQGNPATFDDGADNIPVKDLQVTIVPHQDLHGYDKPWAGGAGKNLLPMTVAGIKAINSGTWNGNIFTHSSGMTVTILTDSDNNVVGLDFNGTTSNSGMNFAIGRNVSIPNGQYIYNTPTASGKAGMWLSTTNPTLAIVLENNTSGNITVSGGTIDEVYVYFNQSITLNHYIIRPMIRLSTVSDATFAPYENLCPITGMTEVEVERTGKNLFDGVIENGTINGTTGENASQSNRYRSKNYILVAPNTAYVFSKNGISQQINVLAYDNEKSYMQQQLNVINGTFTTPAMSKYIRFFYDDAINVLTGLQLELGSTATAYEPYHTPQTVTTDLGRTVYGGTLDVTTGTLSVDRAYCKLTSSDLWTYTDICITNAFTGGKYADATTQSQKIGVISNAFKTSSWAAKEDMSVFMYYGQARYCLKNSQLTSLADWQSYVTNNDVEICYDLVTPLTYTLTPQELLSVLGTNHISTDAESVDVVYRADIALYIENLTEPDADMIADTNITSGSYFMVGNTLYLATANIANGAAVVVGTNCVHSNLASALNAINA